MKNLLFRLIPIIFLSCMHKSSRPGLLFGVISQNKTEFIKPADFPLLKYKNENFSNQSSKVSQFVTFDRGVYMLMIADKDTQINRESVRRTMDGRLVSLVHNYASDGGFSEVNKVLYFTFLDDKRVLFHSPNFIKRGTKCEVGFKRGESAISDYDFNRYRKFSRNHPDYFKLGNAYEKPDVMKGYYFVNSKREVLFVLEKAAKKTIDLIGLKGIVDNDTIKLKEIFLENSFFSLKSNFNLSAQGQSMDFRIDSVHKPGVMLLKDKEAYKVDSIKNDSFYVSQFKNSKWVKSILAEEDHKISY
ncbi:MAG: hypothetical protein LCH67_18615 [Bacteroidetes bacterium]|nr:hypothetical protein [Bacteroidota bacterium]